MEQKVTPPWSQGLILSLICIVFGLIIYFAGQAQNDALSWVQWLIIVGFIIWACMNYAKQMNGEVTFGKVFVFGFKITAALTAILCVYSAIALNFIFPDMVDMGLEKARKNMEAKGNQSAEQIETAIAFVRKHFLLFAELGILFGTAVLGLIASLIGAGVAKKNPNYNPLEQSS